MSENEKGIEKGTLLQAAKADSKPAILTEYYLVEIIDIKNIELYQ
jgi:hypothetical protein